MEQRERFQTEHLAEVASLASADGLWLDVPMWFARGRVPEHVVSPVLRRGFE